MPDRRAACVTHQAAHVTTSLHRARRMAAVKIDPARAARKSAYIGKSARNAHLLHAEIADLVRGRSDGIAYIAEQAHILLGAVDAKVADHAVVAVKV